MIYASFGGLLKDFRIRKNLSQKEVSYAMGWTEASRLSRIEQGKIDNPPREIIDRLCLIMKLEEEEKNQLLLTGNYLPTDDEISKIKKQLITFLEQWPYVAILFDFSWRIIHENKVFKDTYYPKSCPNHTYLLETLFDPDFLQNKYLKNNQLEDWHKFLTRLLTQYKYIQQTRTKEEWYIKHIKQMMKNQLFNRLWQEAQTNQEVAMLGNFGYKSVAHSTKEVKTSNFYFFVLPVLKDPRFQVELFMPASL